MLVPVTQCTGTRNSSRTLSTPTCARPRAPPPDRTRPMRGATAWAWAADGAQSANATANNTDSTPVLIIALPGGDGTVGHGAAGGHGTKVPTERQAPTSSRTSRTGRTQP